jgi:hypothetical protein
MKLEKRLKSKSDTEDTNTWEGYACNVARNDGRMGIEAHMCEFSWFKLVSME